MAQVNSLKEKILENMTWSILSLIGVAGVSLWSLYQNDIVSSIMKYSPKSIYTLGWFFAICFLLLSLLTSYIIHLRRRLSDPFKGLVIDNQTQTCIDPKTNLRYCPSCLGKNNKFPMFHEDTGWYCANRDCPNSHRPATVTTYRR